MCTDCNEITIPIGPQGPVGPAGSTNLTIQNTVFVAKNGNDSTGLPERLDKPFLTLNAARTSALTLTPSASKRILIHVFNGTYNEVIPLANCVDWNLNSCIIDGVNSINATIDDLVEPGSIDSIIYGNADIRKSTVGTAGLDTSVLIRRTTSNVRIYADKISNSVAGSVIKNFGGTLNITCREISADPTIPSIQGITLTGNPGYTNITADKISVTNAAYLCTSHGVANINVREINTLTDSQNTIVHNGLGILTMNSCRITHDIDNINVITVLNSDSLILKDCVIVGKGTANSIVSPAARNIRVYGNCYTNKVTNNITTLVSSVTVDADVV